MEFIVIIILVIFITLLHANNFRYDIAVPISLKHCDMNFEGSPGSFASDGHRGVRLFRVVDGRLISNAKMSIVTIHLNVSVIAEQCKTHVISVQLNSCDGTRSTVPMLDGRAQHHISATFTSIFPGDELKISCDNPGEMFGHLTSTAY